MKVHNKIDGNVFVLRAVETGDQILVLFREGSKQATVAYDMGAIEAEGCQAVQSGSRVTVTGAFVEFTIQAVISCDLSHITGGELAWECYPSETTMIPAGADFMERARAILGLTDPVEEKGTV